MSTSLVQYSPSEGEPVSLAKLVPATHVSVEPRLAQVAGPGGRFDSIVAMEEVISFMEVAYYGAHVSLGKTPDGAQLPNMLLQMKTSLYELLRDIDTTASEVTNSATQACADLGSGVTSLRALKTKVDDTMGGAKIAKADKFASEVKDKSRELKDKADTYLAGLKDSIEQVQASIKKQVEAAGASEQTQQKRQQELQQSLQAKSKVREQLQAEVADLSIRITALKKQQKAGYDQAVAGQNKELNHDVITDVMGNVLGQDTSATLDPLIHAATGTVTAGTSTIADTSHSASSGSTRSDGSSAASTGAPQGRAQQDKADREKKDKELEELVNTEFKKKSELREADKTVQELEGALSRAGKADPQTRAELDKLVECVQQVAQRVSEASDTSHGFWNTLDELSERTMNAKLVDKVTAVKTSGKELPERKTQYEALMGDFYQFACDVSVLYYIAQQYGNALAPVKQRTADAIQDNPTRDEALVKFNAAVAAALSIQ